MSGPHQNTVQLLHTLGYLHAQNGELQRGLVLLQTAAHLDPNNVGILRMLAHVLVAEGSAELALSLLARLRTMEDGGEPALTLLAARALWASGRHIEARQAFAEFLDRRRHDDD